MSAEIKKAGTTKAKPSEMHAPNKSSGPKTFTGVQLATAFDGKLEPRKFSLAHKLNVLMVASVMLLMPLIYFGILVGTIAGIYWYATHAIGMFKHIRGGYMALIVGIIYIAPMIAGALLAWSLLTPLFLRRGKRQRAYWVDRREQPVLYAYVDCLCDAMHAPRPSRIEITAAANASAYIDNGLFGIVDRRLVLSIGLPLAQSLDLRQFTGVLAHELGHFGQGLSMRLSYMVFRINEWFAIAAHAQGGMESSLQEHELDTHWTVTIIVSISRLVLIIARGVLWLMALISHAVTMSLSRQGEFDADYSAARIVGSDGMGRALETIPILSLANDQAIDHAREQWNLKKLPDDLVILTHAYSQIVPTKIRNKLETQLLTEETSWFDSHPRLFQRIGKLKQANLKGVLKLDGPSSVVFKDLSELSKIATIDMYQMFTGDGLQPEFLVATQANSIKWKI